MTTACKDKRDSPGQIAWGFSLPNFCYTYAIHNTPSRSQLHDRIYILYLNLKSHSMNLIIKHPITTVKEAKRYIDHLEAICLYHPSIPAEQYDYYIHLPGILFSVIDQRNKEIKEIPGFDPFQYILDVRMYKSNW